MESEQSVICRCCWVHPSGSKTFYLAEQVNKNLIVLFKLDPTSVAIHCKITNNRYKMMRSLHCKKLFNFVLTLLWEDIL
jgi:hypothetical protein